jgi:hypothetical protein
MISINTAPTGRLRPWLETLTISLLGPAVGLLWCPADPFFVHTVVPWLIVTPLLCGAQYGALHGLVSTALLSVLAFGHALGVSHWDSSLGTWGVGCMIVGALSGQFRDVAERRRASLIAQVRQMSEQLERAQRSAHLLKLSHARLEERLAAGRWSLAGALDAAARRIQVLSQPRKIGEVLLEVLATQSSVLAASLFGARGLCLQHGVIASLGDAIAIGHDHPLVERAWRTRRLAAVVDPVAHGQPGDLTVLAAVPLLTSSGRCVGVVAIHNMPFMAFQAEQLRNLFVIAGQLSDLMHARLLELEQTQPVAKPSSRFLPVPPPPLGALGSHD